MAVQCRERILSLPVVGQQRAAAEPVVLSRAGTVGGVDAPQGRQEPGQVNREPNRIGNPVRAGRLAAEPLVDRPRIRVTRAGLALRQRHGNRQRELGGQSRKPPMFLVDRQGVLGRAGEPHQHFGAETERPVVPAAVGNGLYWKTGPPGKLLSDQTTRLLRVDGDALGHGTEIRCVTQATSSRVRSL